MPNNAPEYLTRPATIAYERDRQRARQRAFRRLSLLFPVQFKQLLAEEMDGVVRPGRLGQGRGLRRQA